MTFDETVMKHYENEQEAFILARSSFEQAGAIMWAATERVRRAYRCAVGSDIWRG